MGQREWPGRVRVHVRLETEAWGRQTWNGPPSVWFCLGNVTKGERAEGIGKGVIGNPGNLSWTRKKVKAGEVRED